MHRADRGQKVDKHEAFRRSVERRIRRITAREHVSVLPRGLEPVAPDDPGALVADVPWVHVDRGMYRGPRRRLRFAAGESVVTLNARTRGRPRATSARLPTIDTVSDEREGERPASSLDRSARTIDFLVDLDSAELEAYEGRDPAGAVAEILYGRPLRRLIEGGNGDVRVGSDVSARVASLLGGRAALRSELSRREIALLRQMRQQAGGLPPPLQLRMELFEREAGSDGETGSPEVPPARVERELRRLKQLVASRACGMLRLTDETIEGLVGPRPLRGEWWIGAVRFELRPTARSRGPYLGFSDPARPDEPPIYPCLGAAFEVLPRMSADGDLFGLVDTVLNFVETNAVGSAPWDRWPAVREPALPF